MSFLDLGENEFSGKISKWIGELPLHVLRLRGNLFYGSIGKQLCLLAELHILDLAQNKFSGAIPACLSQLDVMKSTNSSYSGEESSMELNLKGIEYMYESSILPLVKMVDLSCNNLTGLMPEDITTLKGLGTLNLSNNHLTGKIASRIGEMQNLETLDLSSNHFYGQIPPSISSMTLLSHLNLSHNNLSGPIPSSTQLSGFSDSVFEGNLGLCGVPLLTKCKSLVVQEEGGDDPDEVKDEKEGGR